MTDDKPEEKAKASPLNTRDLVNGVVVVIGFTLIASGLNGSFGWGLPDTLVTALGAAVGVAAAFGLSWLRKR